MIKRGLPVNSSLKNQYTLRSNTGFFMQKRKKDGKLTPSFLHYDSPLLILSKQGLIFNYDITHSKGS